MENSRKVIKGYQIYKVIPHRDQMQFQKNIDVWSNVTYQIFLLWHAEKHLQHKLPIKNFLFKLL